MNHAANESELGGKPCRLVDIARRANVSHVTVSHVLMGTGRRVSVSESTTHRVREIARELNYRPNYAARQLRGKASHVTGVLISRASDFGHTRILEGAERVLEENGQLAVVGHTHDNNGIRKKYVEEFAARNVDFVICLTVTSQDTLEELNALLKLHPKMVFYSCSWPLPQQAIVVDVDRAAPARMAVDHLISRGRRRVGLVLWADNPADLARRNGYTQGLSDAGMEFDEQLIYVHGTWHPEAPPQASVERALDELVNMQEVDSLVAYDDFWGVVLIRSLQRRGVRVPQDVAVVGAENLPAGAVVDPELTTVDPQYLKVGEELALASLKMLKNDRSALENRLVVIPPELIVRQSS
jgi:DNA-binding LacI/PurR family transcriptional regulator